MMLVLASLAVPSLTLCVGVSILYVELLKFEGGAMVDMVPQQYFHLKVCVFCCVMKPWERHLIFC